MRPRSRRRQTAAAAAELPQSGQPDPRRASLVAEAALCGWTEQGGRRGSLDWLERRLAELRGARLEPIDWTVACVRAGCSRQGEAIAPGSDDWGESCAGCLDRPVVVRRGLSPGQLEAALRAGEWRLAEASTGAAASASRSATSPVARYEREGGRSA